MLFNINVIQNKILLSQIKNTKILISIITIAVSSTVYILLLSKVKCKCDYNYLFVEIRLFQFIRYMLYFGRVKTTSSLTQ